MINCYVCQQSEMEVWQAPYSEIVDGKKKYLCSIACKEALPATLESRIKEKEKINRENIEEKKRNFQLSALDTGIIAKAITDEFSLDELQSILPMFNNTDQKHEVINDANNKLIEEYKDKIKTTYDERNFTSDNEYFEMVFKSDIKRCMHLGVNAIKRKLDYEESSDQTSKQKKARLISKKDTWNNIKNKRDFDGI